MQHKAQVIIGHLAALALALACQPAFAQVAVQPPAAGPAPAQVVIPPHAAGAEHAARPARLEAVVEMDMAEWQFGAPVFRVPVGKTIGFHLHNEGVVLHELAIGRGPEVVNGVTEGYATNLFTELKSDLFFYWGGSRVELEGARFEELEVDPGLQDIWIRLAIPEELAGEWEIGCFTPAHYEAGMHATLIVE